MFEITGLYKSFRKKDVLNGVNLQFDNGVYGLLGPNGAGKTTLIRCITGLYEYSKGSVTVDRNSIGYLPQSFGTYNELSLREAMEMFCVLKNIPKNKQQGQIAASLESVNLYENINDKVKTLSGGMLRRLGIAQTLLGEPEVLIYDEPTAGLDPEERLRFKRVVSQYSKDRTVIISTHIVEDVESVCDNIIVMKGGHILKQAAAGEIAAAAANKVYVCKKDSLLQTDVFIEKEFEENGQKKYRILSSRECDMESKPPTIEDGYLCILKNI